MPPPIVMFVKDREKRTLVENFVEVVKVEKDLSSISSHQGSKESKSSSLEKSIKKNKGILKSDSPKKDKETTNMESMKRAIKQLTTKRTKENEENNLLSLINQLKAWEEKFWPLSQMIKLHI